MRYLLAKSRIDTKTREFYLEEKWRSWRFQIYCSGRRSEDRLCNTIGKIFGPSCTIHYGNWSSSTQQIGCAAPTPNKSTRLILQSGRTTKICNSCVAKRYRKRGAHSRLFCPTCSSRTEHPTEISMLRPISYWQALPPLDHLPYRIATLEVPQLPKQRGKK